MLDPEQVDLADLALALEDHSPEHSWWFDRETGAVTPHFDGDGPSPAGDGLIGVEPLPPSVGYGDMEDFAARVRDPHARDRLERSIAGRGAFRRFKDALLDHPELRRSWFAFHDARGERRAIEWLAERGMVAAGDAEAALLRREDPAPADLPGLMDAEGIARRVALDLRRVHRGRLQAVLLVGAWARGDAARDAAVEVLVVLDEVRDRWAEMARMDRVMWRHTIRNDTVVLATPVSADELEHPATPRLARARAEGIRVL